MSVGYTFAANGRNAGTRLQHLDRLPNGGNGPLPSILGVAENLERLELVLQK